MVAAEIRATLDNIARLGSNPDVLLRALEHRAELAGIELLEARREALAVALGGLIAAALLLLAGLALTLFWAALFWDTPYRAPALAALGVLECVGALLATARARRAWRRCRFFEETRTQLKKDSACLREVLATAD